ncbi:MAG: TRAP transporter large permease [Pseudomonadota bacterium]|nr:TRAP transporter large permease [Pseudomonadota bacterium]
MSDLQIGGLSLVALVLLLVLRVPIAVALGVVSVVGIAIIIDPSIAWALLRSESYDFVANWSLSSVPMFLLMGYVCYQARLTDGLFRLARLWLSGLPGGLAIASIGGAAGFSAVTGSSVACAAALSRIAVPEMLKSGYDKGLAAGTVSAAGTLGSLIPPSILILIYGIYAEVPIGKLFIGAVGPGLLTAFAFALMVMLRVKITPSLAPPTGVGATWADRFDAIKETWPVLLLVLGVFGGLFGGIFTPTEAGAIGAFLAFVIAAMKGTLTWASTRQALSETLTSTASIFIIALGARLLTKYLALAGLTDYIADEVGALELSPTTVMLALAVIYVLLGMFLDPLGILLLTLPIFLPLVDTVGIEPILFGVLVVKLLEIGLITPPVGINVFVVKGILGDIIATETIFRGILWFVAADLVVVALMIAFPAITLALPGWLG